MIGWIMENISTIIVCAVLIAVVTAVICNMVKNKRRGQTSCGCGCDACAMKGSCHGGK